MKTKDAINTIKGIFAAAGFPCEHETRRSRAFKGLCDLIESGLITFEICENGFHWVSKKGNQYNVLVQGVGRLSRYKIKGNVQPINILKACGNFLQGEEVKKEIKSFVNLDLSCDRCQGRGHIPQYSYWCNGICFECYGTGYSKKKKIHVEIVK